MDCEGNLLHTRLVELEVGGRREDGIAADDDEHVNRARVYLADERPEVLHLIYGVLFDRLEEVDGLPRVAERRVHLVRERVNLRPLLVARDDD